MAAGVFFILLKHRYAILVVDVYRDIYMDVKLP